MALYKLVAKCYIILLENISLLCKIARTICLIIYLSCMHTVLYAFDGSGPASFSAIRNSISTISKTSTSTLDQIAASLNKLCTNDEEKAYAIYIWIANNISYDVASLSNGTYTNKYLNLSRRKTAEIVFGEGQAVCGGYACLYEAMAKCIGLKVEFIEGYSKGITYAMGKVPTRPDHAWNAVFLNGDYRLLDCSWGAGFIRNGKFVKSVNDFYFETPPEAFIFDHFPVDQSKQFLKGDKICTRAKYEDLVELRPEFFLNNLEVIDRQISRIITDTIAEITVGAPDDVIVKPEIHKKEGGICANSSFAVERNGNRVKITTAFPGKGEYIVTLAAKHKSDPGSFDEVANYIVTAKSDTTNEPLYPHTFDPYLTSNASLISPTKALLPLGSSQLFKLTVPGARKVIVYINESQSDLTKNGDTFENSVLINGKEGDSVDVYAQFEGDKDLSQLVSYKITKQNSAFINP